MIKNYARKLVYMVVLIIICCIPATAHALDDGTALSAFRQVTDVTWDGVFKWQNCSEVTVDYEDYYGESGYSIVIDNYDYNDYGIYKSFEVKPDTYYVCSVMTKVSGFKLAPDKNILSGAGIQSYGISEFEGSSKYSGTEWKKLEYKFYSGDNTTYSIALRNGTGSGDCKGKAYFSNFKLTESEPDKWDGVSHWRNVSETYLSKTVSYGTNEYSIVVNNIDYNAGGAYKYIPVKKNTAYKASVWVKYSGFKLNPDDSNASGATIGSYDNQSNYTAPYKGTSWKKIEFEFYSGNKTEYPIILMNGVGSGACKGKAYFSGFKIQEINLIDSCTLIYGNADLKDKNAFVITILGDGYKKTQQEKFLKDAKTLAEGFMKVKPWSELKTAVKIYAVGTASKESGAKGDKATSYKEMQADTRDTFYGAHYWNNGIERSLVLENSARFNLVLEASVPYTDNVITIVNSAKHGGSGGAKGCVSNAGGDYIDTALHELGHSVAGLADEYNYGENNKFTEHANLTKEKDPSLVKWKKFIGNNGIGVVRYEGTKTWYVPSEKCKMHYLHESFCEVCKEEIRKSVLKNTTRTVIYYQPYGKKPKIGSTGFDIRQYMMIRKGTKYTTGSKVKDLLTVTYYNSSNVKMSGAPKKAGTYYAKVSFKGNDTYGACSQKFKFKIYS